MKIETEWGNLAINMHYTEFIAPLILLMFIYKAVSEPASSKTMTTQVGRLINL